MNLDKPPVTTPRSPLQATMAEPVIYSSLHIATSC